MSDYWQSRDRAQKIKLFSAMAGILITLSIIFYFILKPTYVPLYSDLEPKDAGEIVKKLEDMKIPYELRDSGKTIMVDPKYKYKTRLELAQEGLPKGSAEGFSEIFDKTKLGTTDWERQVQYNQALQGELTRTIEEMPEVEKARIHIVQPERKSFIDVENNYTPSAAVFLKLKAGENLEKDGIWGIINLISHSVKGLDPENVTIIDEHGRVLSNISLSPDDELEDSISNQLTIQTNFQGQLQNNVQSLLEQVFGPGNVAVRVNAKLNFDKRNIESKSFTPVNEEDNEGILRSVQELREHFEGTGSVPGGVPGVDSGVAPGYAPQQEGDSEYSKTEVIRNYEINEALENLSVAPGFVDRLTVSVVVNQNLTEDEKYSIAQIVGNAIGYNPDRDQVSVEGMEFENPYEKYLTQIEEREQRQKDLQRYIAIAALLLALTTGVVLYRRRKIKEQEAIEEEQLQEELKAVQEAAAAQEEVEAVIEPLESDVYKNIMRHARRRPEDIAKVLRTWLTED